MEILFVAKNLLKIVKGNDKILTAPAANSDKAKEAVAQAKSTAKVQNKCGIN